MSNKDVYRLTSVVLVCVFGLSATWEFAFSDYISGWLAATFSGDPAAGRWGLTLMSTAFAGIAVLFATTFFFDDVRRQPWTKGTAGAQADIARDLRLAEAALRASEQRFKNFTEVASDWFWEIDENLRFVDCSLPIGRVSGLSPIDMIGKTRWELVGANPDKDSLWRHHRAILEAHKPFRDFRYTVTDSEGRLHHWTVNGTPVFDEDGIFRGFRGTTRDEATGGNVESRAETSTAQFLEGIESVSDGFAMYDADDRLVLYNSKYILSDSGHEYVKPGVHFEDIVRAGRESGLYSNAPGGPDAWARKRLAYHRNPTGVIEFLHQDGRWLQATERKTSHGGTVTVWTDITEHKLAEEALRASEERLRAAVESLQEGFALFDAEDRLVILNDAYRRTNPRAQEILEKGGTYEDLIRANVGRGAIIEAKGREEAFIQQRIDRHRNPGGAIVREFDDGSWCLIKETRTMDGGTALTFTDISQFKRVEQELRDSERRFRNLVDGSIQGILIHQDRKPIYVNQAWAEIHGYTVDEVLAMPSVNPLIAPHEQARMAEYRKHRMRGETAPPHYEYQAVKKDGSQIWLENLATIVTWNEQPAIQSTIVDITERKHAEAQLEFLALHDNLTNLPNRFLFHDRLGTALEQSRRNETVVALLFLDLVNLKAVNDTLGRDVGDDLIKAVAHRLHSFLRASDTIGRQNSILARIGGDEFTILLTNLSDPSGAATVAIRIVEEFSRPFDIGPHQIRTSVCIGIAIFPDHGSDPRQLLRNADLALNRSKADGENVYHFYSGELEAEILARKSLEWDLRQALAEDQLSLAYQPLVDVRNGTVVGIEALLRWNHPTRGLIPPATFIPIAEATGLIIPIGEWVLCHACLQNKAWQDNGLAAVPVAVNLSAFQFRKTELVETVDRALGQSGLPPAHLHLEITESAFMEDRAGEILLELNERGVKFSLDDFGTGYSSLSYLTRFSVHKIKLDSSFVHGIEHNASNASIIGAVSTLGHNLGMRIAIEGVETETQLEILRSTGVDEIQGFIFSRPLHPDDVPQYLSENGAQAKPVSGAA